MKPVAKTLIAFAFIFHTSVIAQVKIHAHNDYEKPHPLTNALNNKVFSIEADVFIHGNSLVIAHSREQINPEITLNALYIKPIVALFRRNKGHISASTGYDISLLIDIKEKGEEVLQRLETLLEPFRRYFDRSLNKHAVHVVISGDRGPITSWKSYPSYFFFDGRPYEQYDSLTLERVAMISDNYQNYARGDILQNTQKIKTLINKVHELGKPIRFWGTPDNEPGWTFLYGAGVDIINTDKVELCRNFFDKRNTLNGD